MMDMFEMLKDNFNKNEYYITEIWQDKNDLSRTSICKMSKKEFKQLVKQFSDSESCKNLYLFNNGLVAVFK